MANELVTRRIRENIAAQELFLSDAESLDAVRRIAQVISESLQSGGKVMFFGNGGSAADAQHLAAELTGRYLKERPSLAGLALTTNASSLTAIGNDFAFESVFSRQVQGLGAKGDVAVGITTSGNSPNVLKAMEVARGMGIVTVGFTGKPGGRLRSVVDHCLCAQATQTPRIQETHILAGHIICELVENEFTAR